MWFDREEHCFPNRTRNTAERTFKLETNSSLELQLHSSQLSELNFYYTHFLEHLIEVKQKRERESKKRTIYTNGVNSLNLIMGCHSSENTTLFNEWTSQYSKKLKCASSNTHTHACIHVYGKCGRVHLVNVPIWTCVYTLYAYV